MRTIEWLLDLVASPSQQCAELSGEVSECIRAKQKNAEIAIKLLQAYSVVPSLLEQQIALFFSSFPAPSQWMLDDDGSALECAKSMLLGLYESTDFLPSRWQWDDVIVLCEHHDSRVRWYGRQCLGCVLGVPFSTDENDDVGMQMEWRETLATIHMLRKMLYSHSNTNSSPEREKSKFEMAVSIDGCPILLEGPPSSGKSTVIRESYHGKMQCIRIHLDDQMDAKSLLGGYVCTSKPGEFSWSPGPVVRAMQNGCWLVLENLNLASTEVITLIQSVSKTNKIHIASRGQVIKAQHGFRLIATCTTTLSSPITRNLLPASVRIQMNELSFHEQKHILQHSYSIVSPLLVHQALVVADVLRREHGDGRIFTFRDVIKWARRMTAFHSKTLTHGMPAESSSDIGIVPMPAREAACIEFVDCACMSTPKESARIQTASMIATHFAIPNSWIEQHLSFTKPSLEIDNDVCQIGRARLSITERGKSLSPSFAKTGEAMRLMEKICAAVCMDEPVLVVGETGVGKTTVIQEVARIVDQKFAVVNLSQQSDSSDLIGGFRPKSPGDDVIDMLPTFLRLVKKTWTRGNNEEFLSRVVRLGKKKKWIQLLKAYKAAANKWLMGREARGVKRKRPEDADSIDQESLDSVWRVFHLDVEKMEAASSLMERGFAFGFTEGILVKAFREGWWLLLDEINLAPTEVLEKIAGLLDSTSDGWILSERGDEEEIPRHPEFRIFCAMNPATDSGKKNLPPLVRNRFTEFWVNEPSNREDLLIIAGQHLGPIALQSPVSDIVDLYIRIKEESMSTLQDGAGVRPVYNLRTLTRALEYVRVNSSTYGIRRALVDGFAMSFQTQLDAESSNRLDRLFESHLLPTGVTLQSISKGVPESPSPNHILFGQYWIQGGSNINEKKEKFITTPTVQLHLKNLARAVLLRKYPILLQGPTSSGKTSLITHLASVTGHKCIRINNHEHTDIQEYIGFYISDSEGRLVFNEGPLVQALRQGHWVILDELNLAPSEVLEALNRLLDDNRELFIPELQEVVKPNENFMLFATQNPPGIYAGRKSLSRAFRSRFLELHVDDIPDVELHEIIEKRCSIAPSYAKRMIAVMRELQRRRSAGNLFAGRHGYITPRDLFRWANRPAVSYNQLAFNGFFVLGERLRSDVERQVVLQTLQTELKVKIAPEELYLQADFPSLASELENIGKIVWTPSFKRMYFLLQKCLENGEPALLVGETGIGKTTACQLLAASMGQELRILNCNQHTETSDFLGGYRPNRSRKSIIFRLRDTMSKFDFHISDSESDSRTIQRIKDFMQMESSSIPEDVRHAVLQDMASFQAPFEWVDGPLINAMKNGDILLLDELNLAEDAVLERLNSVLESGKAITLAEKGGAATEVIQGHAKFQIIATMNPGGDFGKKELSPALMNRFTSIWVPQIHDRVELLSIVRAKLRETSEDVAGMMLDFCAHFEENISSRCRQSLSVRDILSWVQFINEMVDHGMGVVEGFRHGAELVIIDGLGLGCGVDDKTIHALQAELRQVLSKKCEGHCPALDLPHTFCLQTQEDRWGIPPFFIECGSSVDVKHFNFDAKTTKENLFRLVRAMQLKKPILLEGSPGVGKTTLVEAMSVAVGRKFVRINLSDQTDMMDLLGANLPSPDGGVGDFSWSDGPLLQAMRSGSWVLLDELNLACQSVLEGLNALLDHRGEIFVPELNTVVKCSPGFRLFGAQNPVQEGGGRKGLPKSFLNRFIRVRIQGFSRTDLIDIASSLYSQIPEPVVQSMADCLLECSGRATKACFDFNLRDLLRWCKLVDDKLDVGPATENSVVQWTRFYGSLLLASRMRSVGDRNWVEAVLSSPFEDQGLDSRPDFAVLPETIRYGSVELWKDHLGQAMMNSPLENFTHDHILIPSFFRTQEILCQCIKFNWLGILVGPTGCGKSGCITNIATCMGKKVVEIQLHQGTDISDLLGGFEQVDLEREGYNMIMKIKAFLQRLALHLVCARHSLKSLKSLGNTLFNSPVPPGELSSLASQTIVDNFKAIRALLDATDSKSMELTDCLEIELEKLAADASEYLQRKYADRAGKFEWIDGTLTRCILDGSWVILRDANLCDPSILDRLNPLFEPDGIMSLNECGSTVNGPRVVVPHQNFRMFITYDPIDGEISRAMRNRGIEVFFSGIEQNALAGDIAFADVSAIVAAKGLPTTLSEQLAQKWLAQSSEKSNLQTLAKQAEVMHALISRGNSLDTALGLAFEDFDEFVSDRFHIFPDMNAFLYPRVDQLYAAGAIDKFLADWEFVLKMTRGSYQAEVSSIFRSLVLDKQTVFALVNRAGYFESDSISRSYQDMEMKEGAVNAAITVFLDEDRDNMVMRCSFLLNIAKHTIYSAIGSLESDLKSCSELQVVHDLLNDLVSNPDTATAFNRNGVRISLEKHRLKRLVKNISAQNSSEECCNALELAIWCHKNPFYAERVPNKAVLQWIWPTLESLYDLCMKGEVEDFYDDLSLFRCHLLAEPIAFNVQRIAHSWHTLWVSLREVAGELPPSIVKLSQNLSRILLGYEETAKSAERFLEMLGRPVVALNLELHELLSGGLDTVKGFRLSQDLFELYHEDCQKHQGTVLIATEPDLRKEVLDALEIAFAGSILDADSIPRVMNILSHLKNFGQSEKVKKRMEASGSKCTANSLMVFQDPSTWTRLASLGDIIARRMEFDLILRWNWSDNRLNDKQEAIVEVVDSIIQVPTRSVADALPYRVMLNFEESQRSPGNKILIAHERRMTIMASLQMFRDLRLDYPEKNIVVGRGPAILHTCSGLLALCSVIDETDNVPVRQIAYKLHQIHRCTFNLCRMSKRDLTMDVHFLEWRKAVDMLLLVAESFATEERAGFANARDLIGTLRPNMPNQDALRGLHGELSSVFQVSLSDQSELLSHLEKSLGILLLDMASTSNTPTGMQLRGKSLALLSFVYLILSRPYEAFDPVLAKMMEKEDLQKKVDHLLKPEIVCRRAYSVLPLSSPQKLKVSRLLGGIELINRKQEEILQSNSARPQISQYHELRDDINEFIEHFIEHRMKNLIAAMEASEIDEMSFSQAESWNSNVDRFIESLERKYPCYKDIYGPVELSLRTMQYSIDLMRISKEMNGNSDLPVLVQSLVENLLSINPKELSLLSDEKNTVRVLEAIHGGQGQETKSEKVASELLKLYGFNLQILQQQLTKVASLEQRYEISKKFEIIAMRVHKLWKKVVDDEKYRIIEESRSFEIKGRQIEIGQDEEDDRAFRSLFLGSLSIFEDIDFDEEDKAEKIKESGSFEDDQCLVERKEVSDMVLSRLFDTFTSILNLGFSDTTKSQEGSAPQMNCRLLSGMEMIQGFGGLLPSSLDQFGIPGFLYTLSSESNYLSGNVEEPVFNIYSRNIKEASRALEPVTNVLVKVDELLDEWPDHPILDQLKKISTRILSLPLKSTLKDYSTGIELLLSRAQIWEETAAKHVSLSDHLKPLISIANSWREFELKSWKDSLNRVRREMIKEARESWFFMFGIVTEDLDSFVDFVNIMDSFIQSSTVGQFEERVNILQKFGSYLEKWCPEHVQIDQKNLMAKSLKNMAAYYVEYAPVVEKYISQEMKPLEKELSDFISLAKWEDRGFYAMKSSKEKAYKQLHKITRKAKDLLSTSCSICLRSVAQSIGIDSLSNTGISSGTESLLASFQDHILSLPVEEQSILVLPNHAEMGKYSGQIDRLLKKFKSITSDPSLLEKLHDLSQRMHEVSVVALKQSALLRTDISKGAKSRKKKALSDYFKALEGYGISKLQSSIPRDARDANYWTRVNIPYLKETLEDMPSNPEVDKYWNDANSYYFKSIACARQLAEVSQQPHEDIQPREVQISNNLGIYLLFMMHETRSLIGESIHHLEFFRKATYAVSKVRDICKISYLEYIKMQEQMSSCVHHSSVFTDYLRTLIDSSHENLPLEKMATLLDLLESSSSLFLSLMKQMIGERDKTMELGDGKFFISAAMETLVTKECLQLKPLAVSIYESCTSDIPGVSDLCVCYKSFVEFIDKIGEAEEQDHSFNRSVFCTAYEDLVTSCLIWAQNSTLSEMNFSLDSIPILMSEIRSSLAMPQLDRVQNSTVACLKMVTCSNRHGEKDMMSNALLILEIIREKLQNTVLYLLVAHRCLAKLSFVSLNIFCNLIRDGFCIPKPQGEEEEIETTKEGTGLGEADATGANDISNQLDDEDQILGAEKTEQKDEEKETEDKGTSEAQGIEMEDDFEGQMEDIPEDDDGHESQKSEDEMETEQLEQQMGDTKDADEVDEKMWDQEDEESDKVAEDDNAGLVDNADSLDYAQGNENAGDLEEEENVRDEKKDESPKEGHSEEEEPPRDYEENVDTGFLEPEQPDEATEFPDQMNLDDVDENDQQFEENEPIESDVGEDDKAHSEEEAKDGDESGEDEIESGSDQGNDGVEDMQTDEADIDNPAKDDEVSEAMHDMVAPQADEVTKEQEQGTGPHQASTGEAKGKESNEINEEGTMREGEDARGIEGQTTVDNSSDAPDRQDDKQTKLDTNPFRSVNAAAERWEKKNIIDEERDDEQQEMAQQQADGDQSNQEHRFVREDENQLHVDDSMMADATEEQAQHADRDHEHKIEEVEKVDKPEEETADAREKAESAGERKEGSVQENAAPEEKGEKDKITDEITEVKSEFDKGTLLHLDKLKLIDETVKDQNTQDMDSLQKELELRISQIKEEEHTEETIDLEYGREIWSRCEGLTSHLSGRLAEELRLILEPTLASKLGGEYRSGKRINMKRVIGYIASHFRKDKIWMRRTMPDKRRYQVLLAIDDSRSMAETSSGAFALESITLICNAMSRIGIGDLGIFRFGGSIGAELLHPLDKPFLPADGAQVMSKMKFNADNTIDDKPMVDLMTSIDTILENEGHHTSSSLQQLVIILADGRFHEKGGLKKAVMDATSRPGVMYAYIVLDNSENSILDMQSVSFGPDGKPKFSKYIDSFPFPLYSVIQDIQHLPIAMSDLLRQWIEYNASNSS